MLQQPQSCNNQALGRVSHSEGGGAESTQNTLRSRKENCLHALTHLNTEMKGVVDAQQRQIESMLAYAAALGNDAETHRWSPSSGHEGYPSHDFHHVCRRVATAFGSAGVQS